MATTIQNAEPDLKLRYFSIRYLTRNKIDGATKIVAKEIVSVHVKSE